MRELIAPSFAEVSPALDDVLPRLGMPADANLTPKIQALLDEAIRRLATAAKPAAVLMPVEHAHFTEIYRGDGRNASDTPLDAIHPRAGALALFVVTLGGAVDRAIAALFAAGDPALGAAVDAFASSAANRTVDFVADRFLTSLRPAIAEDVRVLPYSPGYCGWHVSGQRALFAAIAPADIGVKLQPSCLMTPIKSVSGVLVAGNAAVHRFRPDFPFCSECTTKECVPRMRSTL